MYFKRPSPKSHCNVRRRRISPNLEPVGKRDRPETAGVQPGPVPGSSARSPPGAETPPQASRGSCYLIDTHTEPNNSDCTKYLVEALEVLCSDV